MPSNTFIAFTLMVAFGFSEQNRARLIDDIANDSSFARHQPSNTIEAPGMVYALHMEGLAYRPVECPIPTNILEDGKVKVEADQGRTSACNAHTQTHINERFYLTAINVKESSLAFTLLSVDSHTILMGKNTTSESFTLEIKLPLPKHAMDTITLADVHKLTDPIFTPVKGAPGTTTILIGQTMEEVKKVLGEPEQTVDLGSRSMLVYKRLKVTFADGRVVNVE